MVALLGLSLVPLNAGPAAAGVAPILTQVWMPCRDVVVIGARGSGQDPNLDRGLGKQVDSLLSDYAGAVSARRVGYYPVNFEAQPVEVIALMATGDASYFKGMDRGVDDASTYLKKRYAKCPSERYVLAGYSQGAMVVHRVLSRLATYDVRASRIDGAVLLADGDRVPVHSERALGTARPTATGITWQFVGTSQLVTQHDAKIGALPVTGPHGIGSRVYSLCDAGDIVCNADVAFKSPAAILRGTLVHTGHYIGSADVGLAARAIAERTNSFPATPEMRVWPVALPGAAVGNPYEATMTASGGVGPYEFTLWGTLPAGLAFSKGIFTGTPTTAGTTMLRVKVADARGQIINVDLSLVVTPAPVPVHAVGQGSDAPGVWSNAYRAALGVPVNAVHPWGPGCIQDFRGGSLGDAALMQLGCRGAVYAVTGAHWRKLADAGAAALGYPRNDSHRYGASWTQDFDGGSWGWSLSMIPDVANTKAFVVRTGMRENFLRDGGATGKWGVPIGDETSAYGGATAVQSFTGGTMRWNKFAIGQGATSPTTWLLPYTKDLGIPVSAVHRWGPGCIQDFRGGRLGDAALMQRDCTAVVQPVTGAHWRKVAAVGANTIGYPTNASHRFGASWTQDFNGGSWGWSLLMVPDASNTNAFAVRTGMRERYLRDGGAGGRWGVAVSDEYSVPVGARQNFTGGVMTWRAYSDTLAEGQTLGTDGRLVSMDERFTLVVQGDGNLVQYGPNGAVWASGTVGTVRPWLAMQGDSNLVLYDGNNNARWASGSTTFKGARLVLQNDGNLVVYDRSGAAIWSRGTGRIRVDPSGQIAIRSTLTNRYWTAELNYTGAWRGAIRAERTGASGWEMFQLDGDCRSAAGCGIKNLANGLYLSAELNYTGDGDRMVRARANSVGSWERFQLVGDCTSFAGCGIKSVANGRYLSADYYFGSGDYRYGLVRARATVISGWESFRIYQR